MYEGSETTEPFRETVNWIVIRAALPISSHQARLYWLHTLNQILQLDKLREVRAGRYDEESSDKNPMKPLRAIQVRLPDQQRVYSPIQAANSRTLLSSFRSVAGAPDLGFRQWSASVELWFASSCPLLLSVHKDSQMIFDLHSSETLQSNNVPCTYFGFTSSSTLPFRYATYAKTPFIHLIYLFL